VGILGLVSLQIKSLQISEQIEARFLSDRMIYRQKEHLAKLKKSSPQSFALSFEPLQVLVLEIWLTKVRKTRTMVGLGTWKNLKKMFHELLSGTFRQVF
jgi:hypothetical protein